MDLAIGELARRSGYAVQTLRYYEQIGLMPKPPGPREVSAATVKICCAGCSSSGALATWVRDRRHPRPTRSRGPTRSVLRVRRRHSQGASRLHRRQNCPADGTQGGGQSHAQSVRQGAHSPVQSDRCPGSLFGLIGRASLNGMARKTSAVERLSLESVINRRSADVAVRTALLAVRRSCDYQASYLGPSIAPARCGQSPRVIKTAAQLGGATAGAVGHSA